MLLLYNSMKLNRKLVFKTYVNPTVSARYHVLCLLEICEQCTMLRLILLSSIEQFEFICEHNQPNE